MRREAAALVAGCLLLAAPARAQEARPDEAWSRCGTVERCLDLGAPSDAVTGSIPWRRADPLALASGTPGEPVLGLPDDD